MIEPASQLQFEFKSARLGQVFTPRPVADWMARWACAGPPATILEPSLGRGVFIDALEDLFAHHPTSRWPAVEAFEIDGELVADFQARARRIQVHCRHGDFLQATLDRTYDAVVANPPYVRRHDHAYDEALFREFDSACGIRLSRMTNMYGLFLIRIWQCLAPGGRAAVITPAEWLNADFGAPIKSYFLKQNAIDGIVHFAHASKVFQDAMTTAAITLLRRDRESDEPIRLAGVDAPDELDGSLLERSRQLSRGDLQPNRKWTPLFNRDSGTHAKPSCEAVGRKLSDVARCVRGIATGANDYFTLRESDRLRHGLEVLDLAPCVTKAPHVTGERFTDEDFACLRDADQRVYLLNPRPDLSKAVESYLEEGRRQGVHLRYLPSHRPVWYRPEERPVAPIWVSVFARGRFKFVRNEARALSLTAFHAVYPKFNGDTGVSDLFDYLISDAAQAALVDHRRIYAEGLLKVEPRDVEAMPIPESLYLKLAAGAERDLFGPSAGASTAR